MSNFFAHLKTLYKNNLFKGRLLLALSIFIIVLIIIRITLSPAIIYGATNWLKKQNIDAHIETIDIGLFSGTVSLLNATGSRDGKPLFNIGRVDIFWRWSPLSEKTIEVSKISLDQFSAGIESYSDEMIIGGVHLPLNPKPVPEDQSSDDDADTTHSWAATLGEVTFTNLDVCYLQHTSSYEKSSSANRFVDYCIKLDEMLWQGQIHYAANSENLTTDDLPIKTEGNFTLQGLTLIDNKLARNLLTSQSTSIENVTMTGIKNIHIDRLNMEALSALQRDDKQHADSIHFKQLELKNIKLNNLNALTINAINLNAPGLYLVKPDQTSWEYQQWIPTTTSEKTATTQTDTPKKAETPFNISIANITVLNSDFCYLEKESLLNYCFTLDNFDFTGAINYQTIASDTNKTNLISNAKLSLLNINIHNHTIDRNLLDLKSFTLSSLNMKDVDHMTLAKIDLTELSALQRGKDSDDNTLALKQLIIDDVKYDTTDNAVAINTINLDGLRNQVSINKNGSWEHDKWLPKKSSPTDQAVATESSPAAKPLKLSLNKFTINSNKGIAFTDNSTEPALNVGLQELDFEISQLNSNTPDIDSPLKLAAKTTQQSTIDLAGSVRPFAEKISFDAKGKLKGFDLRTASPATKKAIGHIIKSGQLDADLQLRAVDGVLDNNLALSLYQFNIKSMSAKDAANLDKKFGMPLNQTLKLLRDKDGSIHLDIPITGDINNPSFDPMDAIIKATSKAATVTLVTFYTPYGLIYAGGNVLFDLATAMKFDPVKFNPGSSELVSENRQQLDKLAKLLIEKPQIHLTLCGITNQADYFALYPEKKKSEENKAIVLNETENLSLNKLATERQNSSKNYLIEEGKLTADRLIVCEPEHRTEKEAIAGVEVNI